MPRTKSAGKPDESPDLRAADDVLDQISTLLRREGIVGVQGFSITVRSEKSSVNMRWGDTRIRRRLIGRTGIIPARKPKAAR